MLIAFHFSFVLTTACTTNHECKGGLICDDGACKDCRSNKNCSDSLVCLKGTCDKCTDDDQCDTNLVCDSKQGKCIASCDDSWYSIGTSCYMISVNKENYIDALANCKSYGSNSRLAEVEDQKTNWELGNLMGNKHGNLSFWIGRNSIKSNGSYKFNFRSSLAKFFAWAPEEPSLTEYEETCVGMKKQKDVTVWYPLHCSAVYGFVCEKRRYENTGDLICNDENNFKECGFDGGDCCGHSVDTSACTTCECSDEEHDCYGQGNAKCVDNINTAICMWDGGDCCGSNVVTTLCKSCSCLDPNSNCRGQRNDKCENKNNIESCQWDGEDCCGKDENPGTDFCNFSSSTLVYLHTFYTPVD